MGREHKLGGWDIENSLIGALGADQSLTIKVGGYSCIQSRAKQP